MAIYHLNVASVNRQKQAAGTAGAHARYIMRADAASAVEARHMPDQGNAARAWLNQQEQTLRKNGRVITKIRIALPRELDHPQNVAAVRDFMAQLTDGHRVPWAFAIHDKHGNDRDNPHVHILVLDRDVETGGRVCRFSDSPRDRRKAGLEPNAVEHARQLWEQVGNRHLERAGHAPALDRRSLEAQEITRKPTIHEGRAVRALAAKGERPASRDQEVQAAFHGASKLERRYQVAGDAKQRRLAYGSEIDQGRTRAEFNAQQRAANDNRERSVALRATFQAAAERGHPPEDPRPPASPAPAFARAAAPPAREARPRMAEDRDPPSDGTEHITLREGQQRAEEVERTRREVEMERVSEAEKTKREVERIQAEKDARSRASKERLARDGLKGEFHREADPEGELAARAARLRAQEEERRRRREKDRERDDPER